MPNRTATFASAIVVSLLAAAPLATLAQGVPPAAGDCLSGPKGPAPAGSHWRYHIDHAKRHCWYLGNVHDARAQSANPVAAANASPAATPEAPTAQTAIQGSIANAHAELPSPQAAGRSNAGAAGAWPAPNPSSAAQGANTPDANAQRSQLASRWPGQSDTGSSAGSEPAAAGDTAATQSSATTTESAAATVPLAAADASPARPSSSIQTLLLVMTGALALAGLVASAVVRFGRKRTGRQDLQRDRRAIWDSAMTDFSSQPGFPRSGAAMPRLGIPDELRAADDPDQRIAHMLARLARSAQA